PAGGGVGANPFHSRNSEAWFVQATGLKVVCPSSPSDAKGLMTAAIRDNNPVVFFEHKGLYRKIKEEVPEGEYIIPLGKARIVQEGRDASIICYGSAVHMALEVADRLQKEGVSIEVVDIRTLVPFDEETVLASARKTNRVLITHEATLTGGFAGEISARITEKAFDALDAPIKRVAAFDSPTPFAPTLEKAMLPNAEKIEKELRELLQY
ncbi:MAG: alpha-ketoacid dehydrogenase subunit beta, partial [Bacteroidota bacterium]